MTTTTGRRQRGRVRVGNYTVAEVETDLACPAFEWSILDLDDEVVARLDERRADAVALAERLDAEYEAEMDRLREAAEVERFLRQRHVENRA